MMKQQKAAEYAAPSAGAGVLSSNLSHPSNGHGSNQSE
jgi:hypothetical protein